MQMRLIALALLLSLRSMACSCGPLTVCQIVQQPVIFIGEVIGGGITSLQQDPWNCKVDHAQFKVLEVFRGLPAQTRIVNVRLNLWAGMCSPIPYHLGKRYLVMPIQHDGEFLDGICFSGRNVDQAVNEVRYVREYFAGRMPVNIQGQVAPAKEYDLVAYLLSMGETKPQAGARVTAVSGSRVFSAMTGSDGRYFLPVARPGTYQLHIQAAPYTAEPVGAVTVEHTCAIQDVALSIDNTISGKVWDDKGKPVRNAKVGLIDVDRPNRGKFTHDWLVNAYTERPDGTYLFKNVPIGRYLLVFNPDGPVNRFNRDMPFESTYYPFASPRDRARVIEIQSDHFHLTNMDLTIGRRVDLRRVRVEVVFPDGTPMETATVECTGEPSASGAAAWSYWDSTLRKGVVEFQAPGNRRLKIELSEAYGRDLKAPYTATFEPGLTGINRKFVVKP